jgi:predicted ester cyclase
MRTADRRAWRQAIPNWSFETLRVIADTHRLVADVERELRYAAHLQGLDPRVRDSLQSMRDAVGVLQASLSVWAHTSRQVVAEIATAPAENNRSASAA